MNIVAFASPKGGVAKTTTAVQTCRVMSEGRRVLLVDADPTRSASTWADGMSQFGTATVDDADAAHLARLRGSDVADVGVVDLPGAKGSETWRAMLAGTDGAPVADLLVIPARPTGMDLRPAVRFIREEVEPLGLPYLLALTLTPPSGVSAARARADELRGMGFSTAETISRAYAVVRTSPETGRTVLDIGGDAHVTARNASEDARNLTAEILATLPR